MEPDLSRLSVEDQKRLRLQGISKAARGAFFNGRRKDVGLGNFSRHCCYLCGGWLPCEMERCTHAVCVRILPCCDPKTRDQKAVFGAT